MPRSVGNDALAWQQSQAAMAVTRSCHRSLAQANRLAWGLAQRDVTAAANFASTRRGNDRRLASSASIVAQARPAGTSCAPYVAAVATAFNRTGPLALRRCPFLPESLRSSMPHRFGDLGSNLMSPVRNEHDPPGRVASTPPRQASPGIVPQGNWRTADAYQWLLVSDRSALAWEVLRRNARFVADAHAAMGSTATFASNAVIARWGLHFRR
jgi:hypothetical protein